MLAERAEVLLVSTGKTCFDVTFCPEYCAKIQKGKESEKGAAGTGKDTGAGPVADTALPDRFAFS